MPEIGKRPPNSSEEKFSDRQSLHETAGLAKKFPENMRNPKRWVPLVSRALVPRYNVAFLDARHRARGRCENRINTLKNEGSAAAFNHLWADLAVIAINLVSWMQLSILPIGHDAVVWVGIEAVAIPAVFDCREDRVQRPQAKTAGPAGGTRITTY